MMASLSLPIARTHSEHSWSGAVPTQGAGIFMAAPTITGHYTAGSRWLILLKRLMTPKSLLTTLVMNGLSSGVKMGQVTISGARLFPTAHRLTRLPLMWLL